MEFGNKMITVTSAVTVAAIAATACNLGQVAESPQIELEQRFAGDFLDGEQACLPSDSYLPRRLLWDDKARYQYDEATDILTVIPVDEDPISVTGFGQSDRTLAPAGTLSRLTLEESDCRYDSLYMNASVAD